MEDFLNKAIELLTAMSATATDTQAEELQELLNAVHLHRTHQVDADMWKAIEEEYCLAC